MWFALILHVKYLESRDSAVVSLNSKNGADCIVYALEFSSVATLYILCTYPVKFITENMVAIASIH